MVADCRGSGGRHDHRPNASYAPVHLPFFFVFFTGFSWGRLNRTPVNSTRVCDRLAGQTGIFAKIPTTRAAPALGTAILHMIVFVLSSLCTSTYLSTSIYPPWTCIFTYLGGREHSKRRQVFDGQNYLLKLGGVLAKSRVEYPTLGRTLHFTDITQT